MLFNSYGFLFLFLPITFAGFFWAARFNRSTAAIWLAAASLFFYSWWNPKFTLLLLISICINYCAGYLIAHRRDSLGGKWLLTFAVALNLATLGIFKYANFFIETVNILTNHGYTLSHWVLPLGISFYTFTQIAFLVDSWRGLAREYDFAHYVLFVTYFPHLIAGPVLHHRQMMPQFRAESTYKIDLSDVATGLTIFTIGLAKKILLADSFADYASPVFSFADAGEHQQFFSAWVGALAYTLQLYFDFSGYSDMAIGLSRLFGVRLPVNFNSPYKAGSIIEFWRRWHITLSAFLKDYLYIPLGGNRHGKFRQYSALMATMALGGLWHGANWTFVAWGSVHGLYLLVNHGWRALFTKGNASRLATSTNFGFIAGNGLTFIAVVVAWVFFRSSSMHAATIMLYDMTRIPIDSAGSFLSPVALSRSLHLSRDFFAALGLGFRYVTALIAGGLAITWLMPNTQEYIEGKLRFCWRPTKKNALLWGLVLAICITKMVSVSQFLYFQF